MNPKKISEIVEYCCREGKKYGFQECVEIVLELKYRGYSLDDIIDRLKTELFSRYSTSNLSEED